MIGAVTAVKVVLLLASLNFFIALIDASWAGPINTALLIVLAYVNFNIFRRTSGHEKDLKDVKKRVDAGRREND